MTAALSSPPVVPSTVAPAPAGDPRVGQRATPDELSAMDDNNNLELVNGIIEEKPVGAKSAAIGGKILIALSNRCDEASLGVGLYPADTEFQFFADDPDMIRKPDVAVILRERLPNGSSPVGRLRIAPDLAIEVISPNDVFSKVSDKIRLYLDNGVRMVWVVDPGVPQVWSYMKGSLRGHLLGDVVEADPVLPGVKLKLDAALFDV